MRGLSSLFGARKEESVRTGLCDVHIHILPGVDDGAGDMETARWMLQKEYDEGVRKIIATPHFRYDMFEPSLDVVEKRFQKVRQAASEIGEDFEVYLGCELHSSSDMVSCLKEGKRLTMAGSRYVLVEFGHADEKGHIWKMLQQLTLHGYTPIVAHLERYKNVRGDMDFAEEIKKMGVCIQVNTDSITGKDGSAPKKFCRNLMKEDLLDFVGTDGHGKNKRVPEIAKCYRQVAKNMGAEYADRIFIENPKKMIEGWRE